MQFVNVAPRVLRASDLPATGLIAPAAASATRCSSPAAEAVCYAGWLGQNLKRGQKLATLESGRPRCAARWTAPSASCRWWRCWPC